MPHQQREITERKKVGALELLAGGNGGGGEDERGCASSGEVAKRDAARKAELLEVAVWPGRRRFVGGSDFGGRVELGDEELGD